MSEHNVKVTDIGIDKLIDSIENRTVFPAVKMAVGDSNGSYYEPSYTQTDLLNKQYTSTLYAKGKRNGYLYFDMQLPPSVGGFTIREVGLYDNEDNLLAVSKYPETYKQQAESTSNKTLLIEMQIRLSNEAFNNIIIDDSGNLVTEEFLNETLLNKANVS
ncbi:MAG: phage tail protein, partial [Candidatus Gastranaerophilaceae bacterium]